MCRMFLFWGHDTRLARELVGALARVSACDPLLPAAGVAKRKHRRHLHGWGYALVAWEGEGLVTRSEQRAIPIDEDGAGVERLRDSLGHGGPFGLIVHSRLATSGGLTRHRCHPFHFRSSDGTEFFLAHNGSMKEEPLRARLGRSSPGASDTLLLAQWLSENLGGFTPGRVEELLRSAAAWTDTAMNTVSMWCGASEQTLHLQVTSHVAQESQTEEMRKYFQLFRLDSPLGSAVCSSSLIPELPSFGGAVRALDIGTFESGELSLRKVGI